MKPENLFLLDISKALKDIAKELNQKAKETCEEDS